MIMLYNGEEKYCFNDWQNSSLKQEQFLFSKISHVAPLWLKYII